MSNLYHNYTEIKCYTSYSHITLMTPDSRKNIADNIIWFLKENPSYVTAHFISAYLDILVY